MSFSIVPLEQALADFSMVDSRTRYKQDRFQTAYDKIRKRIGVDAAQDVFSFHPDTVHTPAINAEQTPSASSSPTPAQ